MRVVCIKNEYEYNLTIGKEYDAEVVISSITGREFFCIKNDIAIKNCYSKDIFITIEERRNRKLEEIGIW